MQYLVTEEETRLAKNPHHIFNINVIVTHLAISQVSLEIGHGNPFYFILVPAISGLVIAYLYLKSKKLAQTQTWFVAANWTLAWRRGRNLLMAYAVAISIMILGAVLGNLFGSGLMMNDFSEEGSSTSIIEKISMYFAALSVFVTILYNFLQTGISVYDAGKGIIDSKIEKFIPRDGDSNAELGLSDDETAVKQTQENSINQDLANTQDATQKEDKNL